MNDSVMYWVGSSNTSDITNLKAIEWTDKAPTQEGLYWHCDKDGFIEAYNVVSENNVLGFCALDEFFYTCKGEGGFWLGPLPIPNSPTIKT